MNDSWQECRRRAEANRWAAFSDEDLHDIFDHLPDNDLSQEIWKELKRRKAEESK